MEIFCPKNKKRPEAANPVRACWTSSSKDTKVVKQKKPSTPQRIEDFIVATGTALCGCDFFKLPMDRLSRMFL
jgi:hypothetical protein